MTDNTHDADETNGTAGTTDAAQTHHGTDDRPVHDHRSAQNDDGCFASPAARRATADLGSLGRRDYLRALGAAGAAGVLGSTAATSAAAQGQFDEAAADQRIEENQTAPLEVEVVDQNGDPVRGADVAVEMQEHEFDFGTAVAVGDLLDSSDDGPFRENLLELFNTAVLENAHKWAIWEGNQQAADQAVDWLDENGFDVRGHTCVYSVDYAIPGDVQDAMNSGDAQTVRDRTMDQIEEIVTHYGDTVKEWDVVNEALHEPELIEAVDGQGVTPETSDMLADWYSHAESVIEENGLDVAIATNDYNTLTWPDELERYPQQVQYLANQGVDVDVVGHQGHIGPTNGSGQPWDYQTVDDVFGHYADLPGVQKITEYDMAGDDWNGEQHRADVMEAFLKTAYGHADVEGFVMWGMWDETHWLDEAPFFYPDWSEKAAVDVWRNLLFDEWWTEESGATGADGTFATDAYLGEYEVTVSSSEDSRTETVAVTNADGQRLVVDVEGGDGGACEDGQNETLSNGQAVCDVDGDGNYRDVDASGDVTSQDLGDFFANQHRDPWDSRDDLFDFDGDGTVGQPDVVDLFQQL